MTSDTEIVEPPGITIPAHHRVQPEETSIGTSHMETHTSVGARRHCDFHVDLMTVILLAGLLAQAPPEPNLAKPTRAQFWAMAQLKAVKVLSPEFAVVSSLRFFTKMASHLFQHMLFDARCSCAALETYTQLRSVFLHHCLRRDGCHHHLAHRR